MEAANASLQSRLEEIQKEVAARRGADDDARRMAELHQERLKSAEHAAGEERWSSVKAKLVDEGEKADDETIWRETLEEIIAEGEDMIQEAKSIAVSTEENDNFDDMKISHERGRLSAQVWRDLIEGIQVAMEVEGFLFL